MTERGTERDGVELVLRATRRQLWLLLVPMLLLLAVLSVLEFQQRVRDAESQLLRRAQERAQELEAVVRPAMDHVLDLRRMLELRWNEPPDGGPRLARALQARQLDGAADGWSLDQADADSKEAFGQFWWAPLDGSAPDPAWLRRAQAFLEQARLAHLRAPGFEGTWFAAAEVNSSFGYPWVATERMLKSMGERSLRAIDKPRREAAERTRRDLARDPNDISFWGVPYVSQLNGQLVMSHGGVAVVDGRYVGEVSLDFRLDELQRRAERWSDAAGRVWIVDSKHNVLADSAQALLTPVGEGLADLPVRVALESRLPAGLARSDLDASLFGPDGVHHGQGWVLVAAVRIGSPWQYVYAMPLAALYAQILPSLLPNALLGLGLLLTFVIGQWLLTRNFVRPAVKALGYLRTLAQQQQQQREVPAPQLGKRWQGWVDAVTETFQRQRVLQAKERQTEALKAAIIDHAINGIVSTDEAGHIVEFNPAAQLMFGHAREAVLGRPVGEVIVPERLRAMHDAGMARVSGGGEQRVMGRRVQLPALRADGSEIQVEMVLFRTELDGLVHYTASLSDVTERQQAAEQIERQRDALRQSEKLTAMGSLLAGVAHELNNPLAIVMGRASLLEEKTEGLDLQQDAQRIREAAERCGRIVRTFLNMARQRPATRAPVQVNDLARAAAEMLGYTLRSHGVAVQLQLGADMPEVSADGDLLGQVVLNLIVNAQHALAGVNGATIRIASGLEPRREGREPRVWLRVADNGPGVPTALRQKIFDPFFTTKAEGLGTGLGLSVSRAIVREHGGDLALESGEQGGASFRLSLPVSGEAAAPSSAMPLDALDGLAKARVLVVDDEVEIGELLRAMLESAGYEVANADSGLVALELLAEARFDAIVSDLRMPGMDGAALWREVRERHPALARRMLFVTGDTLSAGASQFLDQTGCARLEKPFAKAELLAALEAVLS